MKLTKDLLNVIKDLNKKNIPRIQICENLNISYRTLKKAFNKLNIKIKDLRKWTREEDNYLIKNYENSNNKNLVTFLKRTRHSILWRANNVLKLKKTRQFIKENMKHTRKYKVNFDYFNAIDTPEKAYWYGFIWADGNVTRTHLNISVHKKDKEILEKFKKAIESESPIKTIKDNRKNDMMRLVISSYRIVEALSKINIKERKTYLDNLPTISDNLFPDFLLGLFDGDGCFCFRNKKCNAGSFTICVRLSLGIWIKQNLEKLNIKNKENKIINVTRIYELTKLYSIMYKNLKTICLQRKLNKFTKFYEINKNKIPHFNCKN